MTTHEGFTPGPWHVGYASGQHLEHGATECHFCRAGRRLLKTTKEATSNPARFTEAVHHHLILGVEDGDGWPDFRDIVAEDGTKIVGNYDYEDGGVCTNWADARLIADAPRLYAENQRLAGLAWRVVAGVLQGLTFAGDEAFANDVRALAEAVKDSGPRAALEADA